MEPLRLVYACLFIYCLIFFAYWTVTLLRRRRPDHSGPKGNLYLGILLAFTRGMLPWRKESALLHPVSYSAGILYHIGSFTSLAVLAVPGLPRTGSIWIALVLGIGFVSGMYLLLKRVFSRHLRLLSRYDDYLSNILVDLMQLSAFLAVLGIVSPTFSYLAAYLVLLYIPFGKLKHCYFFFASRAFLGGNYGRRGVLI